MARRQVHRRDRRFPPTAPAGAFEADRLRDRRLGRAGFRTVRLTPRSLAYEAEIVADLESMFDRANTSSAKAR